MLTLFPQLFSEVVETVREIKGYKFNSYGITYEEHREIINAMEVFHEEFLGRTNACQFHFKNCVDIN